MLVIGFWQSQRVRVRPGLGCYDVRDPLDIAIVSARRRAVIGFLWWNPSPAKIFMGDTGSLALGGILAALAILSRTELLVSSSARSFVAEAGSVIVRSYFRTAGKRIFRMGPFHHHFELKGWAEATVIIRFWMRSRPPARRAGAVLPRVARDRRIGLAVTAPPTRPHPAHRLFGGGVWSPGGGISGRAGSPPCCAIVARRNVADARRASR